MNIKRIINALTSIKWKYLFPNFSLVFCKKGGKLELEKSVKLFGSRIVINEDACLCICKGTSLKGCLIQLGKKASMVVGSDCRLANRNIVSGNFYLGQNNYLMKESFVLIENESSLKIGNNNRLFCTVWVRFHGGAIIGNYNTINQQSEIRCDELVSIGDYNQISMSNRIWDTNTHQIFDNVMEYKEHIKTHFPNFNEDVKPKAVPVIIGNCNWIGENVFLKSSKIGNHNIVGFRTSIINKVIDNDNVVTNCLDYRIKKY